MTSRKISQSPGDSCVESIARENIRNVLDNDMDSVAFRRMIGLDVDGRATKLRILLYLHWLDRTSAVSVLPFYKIRSSLQFEMLICNGIYQCALRYDASLKARETAGHYGTQHVPIVESIHFTSSLLTLFYAPDSPSRACLSSLHSKILLTPVHHSRCLHRTTHLLCLGPSVPHTFTPEGSLARRTELRHTLLIGVVFNA